VAAVGAAGLVACGGKLPENVDHFTVGNTTVRVDSALDVAGVLWRVADSASIPPRGPARRWLQTLTPQLGDAPFARAHEVGLAPLALLIDTWQAPERRVDTTCGMLAPGVRRCFTGNAPMKARMRAFLDAAMQYAPRLAALELELLSPDDRHQDLEDVYTALTAGKALDSAVAAYAGYDSLVFDVTLARTLPTGQTSPQVDPTVPRPPAHRIVIAPDPVFYQRSFRSPTYIWLTLSHQMAHIVVQRLLADHPELVDSTIHLRPAIEGEMVRSGYATALWNEALEEQLARAVTVRILNATNPTLLWAARAEQLQSNMALVPWLEDALVGYEEQREQFRTLSDFAPRLLAALNAVPLDSCRAAPFPDIVVVGVDRHRGVAAWMSRESPFRARGLLEGDTVTTINGDSVSGGGLLLPSRQLHLAIGQNLPYEMGIIGIRRRGRDYDVAVPIQWVRRPIVRVASQNRAAAAALGGASDACRWVRRVVRR
jgi:hypothetical protein